MKKLLLYLLVLTTSSVIAQKVAIIGLNHVSSPDGFTFVATENLTVGEVIYFTENEYDNTTNQFNNLEESVVKFTVTTAINKGNVVYVEETDIATDVFTVTTSAGAGTATKTSTSGNFSIAPKGESLYAYTDTDDDPTNGITQIYAVLYTGTPITSGGTIPSIENPTPDFPNAIVVHGFPAIEPNRVEYKTTIADRTNVSKAKLEDINNYLYGEAHQALSTTVFTDLNLSGASPIIGVAKDATVAAQQVTFNYYIENLGNVNLSSLSLTDDLEAVFGPGNYIVISQPTFIYNPGIINLNTGFNGSTNTQIIAGGSTLAIGQTVQIQLVVQVTNVTDQGLGMGNYSSQSTISASHTTTTVNDLSDNGINPDPNGNGISNEAGENDPTTFTVAQPCTITKLYVNVASSVGSPDGTSWATAYASLKSALQFASTCSSVEEIWVAQGSYKPGTSQTDSFIIPQGVKLLGGFAGTESIANQRNWAVNTTILSGDLNNTNIADAGDSHSIVTVLSDDITLDGFIIEYSFADDSTDNTQIAIGRAGGGMYINGAANLKISNSIFRHNKTGSNTISNGVGGAIINFGSTTDKTTIVNTLFYDNTATANGGAVSAESGQIELLNCTLVKNSGAQGGGIHIFNGQVNIINTLLSNNTATTNDNNVHGTATSITYSYLQDENPIGTGNINGTSITNPFFTNVTNNDFTLQDTSPLLNVGNSAVISETKDLANNNRIINTTIDIGAYESDAILVDFTILGVNCVNTIISFTDNTSSPNGAITSWEWDFGDGNTSTEQNPTHIYTDIINAEIKLKVIDITGKENTITKTFSVQSPKAKFTANPIVGQAFPHTVFFTDQSTLPDTWEWDFGDGGTSTAQNPIHTYIAAGDYTVNLIVKDTMNGCVDKVTDLIKIVVPKAQFSVDDTLGCGPFTVNFTDESTIEGNDTIEEWLWDFGDGNTSTEQNPTHTYESVGVYNVSLTIKTAITGFTNTNTKSNFIQVIGLTPDFSADVTTGCDPLTVRFSDATVFYGPLSDWLWDFGDGTTSNLASPTHTYTQNGEFDVSLTVTDSDGCSKTIIKTAYIKTTETIAPTVLIQNVTVPLNASGVATITAADIDNGSTDNCTINSMSLDVTTFNCTNLGDNSVTLTVTDTSGNSNTATATVTVEDKIQPTVITQNITVELDSSGNASITPSEVNNGSTDNCSIDSVSLDVTTFNCTNLGDNTVTLTVTDTSGNTNTATATVTVEDKIKPTVITQNITVELDSSGNASITPAEVNNGSTDNCSINSMSLDVTTFNCTNLGDNSVTLTVTDTSGNSNTAIATVTVEDKTKPTVITQNITVELDSSGNANITPAEVNNGSTDNCTINSMSLDVTTFNCTNLGDNTVTLTVTDTSGNSNTATATVTVEDKTKPTVICQDIIVVLNDAGIATITTGDIDNGSTDTCGIASMSLDTMSFNASNVGNNTVTLTVTDVSGNTNQCTAIVTVKDVTKPIVITKDITVQLDANGNATLNPEDVNDGSYDASGIASMSLSETTFNCPMLTAYTVILTVTDVNGLSSSEEAVVTFTASDLDNDLIADVCDNDIDGDGVLNKHDNCITTSNPDQKDLDANGVGDVCDSGGLTIPKGFSPNNDGINDTFIVSGLHKYSNNKIEVYNRWGNRVFHSANYQNNWNGERGGQDKKLPAGSYFYVLSIGGGKQVLKGWVYINY